MIQDRKNKNGRQNKPEARSDKRSKKLPKKTIRTVSTKKGVKKYTYLGCVMTRNRSAWCYRLCPPDAEGRGRCGRVAPHSFMGRTQIAIAKHKRKRLKEHFSKLERVYLSAPCNDLYEPGIRVSEGAAEILVPLKDEFLEPDGKAQLTLCMKVLADAAAYAVNSAIDRFLVKPVAFNVYFADAAPSGRLIAKGRYVGSSGDHMMAESVLTDSEGVEIARSSGTFVAGDTELSSEVGHE
jgi:acyl-coenzyme A thioesterase PaaI-like protein